MLGSHLTLNRLLATSYIARAAATSTTTPILPWEVSYKTFDIDHLFLFSFTHVMQRSWTSEELDDPSSRRFRGDSTMTSQEDPGGEPRPVWSLDWCVLPFPLGIWLYIVLRHVSSAGVMYLRQLYDDCMRCCIHVGVMFWYHVGNPGHMALSYVAVGPICASVGNVS